ncbi:MAG: VIT1/CCC1 transporter family protein [Candidatus Nomurabacteria bacterium]|nr:VIT1/CCC1 transporter family protein [Candidatus Nomurabacteria bacterium]
MIKKYSKKYIAEFVYGATDGTVTTFAIISGVVGAGLSPLIVLILGVSNVLADGFSMASSNYLSERSEIALSGHKQKNKHPIKSSAVTFVSFIAIGTIPLSPFIVALGSSWVADRQFLISFIATGIAFALVGAIRGRVTGEHPLATSFETLVIGGIAAGIAFSVGFGLRILIGV